MIVEYLASDAVLRDAVAGRRVAAFTPPSQLTADEWADTHRVLPSETSAITGQWKTAQFEVARGPMRALTTDIITRTSRARSPAAWRSVGKVHLR